MFERATSAGFVGDAGGVCRERAGATVACLPTQRGECDFASFFTHSPDLHCGAGFDGYFRFVNHAWTTVMGWSADQLTAAPFLDFVHPDDREATRTQIDALATGAATILFENRYRHQDGSYRWLQWNAWPVPGRSLIHAAARDITRLKQLEREIIEIADRERQRLGQDLHDGLCQNLAGISALSSTLARKLAASADSTLSAAAVEISALLNAAISGAHGMARGLAAMNLDAIGLNAALKTLTASVQHLFGVACALQCEGGRPRLGREVELHLFRIAQESVSNAVIHGRAERIDISLGSMDGRGLLRVRDDGSGLPVDAGGAAGIGLHIMASRARLIGGSLDVRAGTPRGAVVSCAFPWIETLDTRENLHHADDLA